MNRSFATLLCLVVLSFAAAAHLWLDKQQPANAQDASPQLRTKAQMEAAQLAHLDELEWSADEPYPNFNIDEVIATLKPEVEKLIAKKLTKTSDQLRKNLDRTEFEAKIPAPLTNEISTAELYRRAIDSIFLVVGLTKPKDDQLEWHTAFSTAFVVQEDGVLSTSAHVFDHNDEEDAVIAFDVKGNVYPVVELLAMNRAADTCLFRIAAKKLKPLTLGRNRAPASEIRVIGHPGDSMFYFAAGHISNYEHDSEGQTWLNITADFGQGSSGGPVMDSAGNVVGQVSRTYTLYAGGETKNRRGPIRRVQQSGADQLKVEPKKDGPAKDDAETKPATGHSADPQMVFKACTPVSAIRKLFK